MSTLVSGNHYVEVQQVMEVCDLGIAEAFEGGIGRTREDREVVAFSLCGDVYSRTMSQLITPSTPKTYQASNSAISLIEAFATTPSRVTTPL